MNKQTYHQHLVEMAGGWQDALDGLAPAQVRAIIGMADNLSGMIDGPVTAEFVVGVMHGVALYGSFADLNKPTDVLSFLMPKQDTNTETFAALVGACLAARLLEGVYQP